MILLSRGLAHHLTGKTDLVKDVLGNAFTQVKDGWRPSEGSLQVDVLTAVVDSLPSPDLQWTRQLLRAASETSVRDAESALHTNQAGNRPGANGVAYYISKPNIFDSEEASLSVPEQSLSRPDIASTYDALPLLKFHFIEKRVSDSADHLVLSLPVANTMFQTGQTSFTVYSKWQIESGDIRLLSEISSAAPQHKIYMNLPKAIDLNSLRVRSRETSNGHLSQGAQLFLPLSYLAPPRKIKNIMGNVITKLYSSDGLGEVPASTELETNVSRFLEHEGLEPQIVAVWALIIPQALVTGDSDLVKNARSKWAKPAVTSEEKASLVADLVWRGAKLRKVLSGGGGWGQKAGLLSIDPDDAFSGKSAGDDFLAQVMGSDTDRDSNIPTVASSGDYIAFFAFFDRQSSSTSDNHSAYQQGQINQSLDFGALPSTMDDMPLDIAQTEEPEVGNESVELFQNHFGALSEGGMSLERPQQDIRSKIDVPHARFSFKSFFANANEADLSHLKQDDEKGTLDPKPNEDTSINTQ